MRRLHPETIEDPGRVRALLEDARAEGVPFHRGLNRRADLETATLEEILEEELVLRAPNFARSALGDQVFLNFTFAERPFFFATRICAEGEASRIRVGIPATIYFGERRDRARRAPDGGAGDPRRVEVEDGYGFFREAVSYTHLTLPTKA